MSQAKYSRLKTERKRRGWSQAELAEALGISTKTVIRWERGLAVPFPYYRNKLATLFGKTIEELGLLPDEGLDLLPDEELNLLSDVDENETAKDESSLIAQLVRQDAPPQVSYLVDPLENLQQYVEDTQNSCEDIQSPFEDMPASRQDTEDIHIPQGQFLPSRSLLNINTRHLKSIPAFRSLHPLSTHLLLIISMIQLIVLIMIAILLTFNTLHPASIPATATTVIAPLHTVTPPPTTTYESGAPDNTLTGGAIVSTCSTCPGGYAVGYLGRRLRHNVHVNGALQFNNVTKTKAGNYKLTIYYFNGRGSISLTAYISVDGRPAITLSAPPTGGWHVEKTVSITISLNAGANTIKFYNPSDLCPDIDRIVV